MHTSLTCTPPSPSHLTHPHADDTSQVRVTAKQDLEKHARKRLVALFAGYSELLFAAGLSEVVVDGVSVKAKALFTSEEGEVPLSIDELQGRRALVVRQLEAVGAGSSAAARVSLLLEEEVRLEDRLASHGPKLGLGALTS